jgi:hypothetical protein
MTETVALDCEHKRTRPTSKSDPRRYCVSCLQIVESDVRSLAINREDYENLRRIANSLADSDILTKEEIRTLDKIIQEYQR